jgi:hypothetical protein
MMKRRLGVLVVGLLMAGVVVESQGRGNRAAAGADRAAPIQRVSGSVQIVFGPQDAQIIREYYAPRYRNLPPGLQKKLERTGQLPPGWQKRFEPFPVVVERQLAALPAGYRRGVVDGHAVIFDDRTHVMVDVAVLF